MSAEETELRHLLNVERMMVSLIRVNKTNGVPTAPLEKRLAVVWESIARLRAADAPTKTARNE